MNSIDSRKTDFASHYKQLELDHTAGWDAARANYRRLVNLWHPDRFAQRPRERIHAQQQFITVTKSYNALRNFYRKNERLPFQSARVAMEEQAARMAFDGHATTQAASKTPNQVKDDDPVSLDTGILGRDESTKRGRLVRSRRWRSALWIASGGALMLGTIAFVFIQDRKANQAVAEKGREVIKQAPTSDFLPSASEIRKSQTRGAFVKPPQ